MADIFVPISCMLMILGIVVGLPIARAYARRLERTPPQALPSPELIARLDRIEQAIEAMATEVERISEGQRFTTKLLAKTTPASALPAPIADRTEAAAGDAEADRALRSRSSATPDERPTASPPEL